MAFSSGPVSYQRFFVTGKLPAQVDDTFVELIRARAFGRLAPLSDDTQVGWINPTHLFATDIDGDAVAYGPYALLAVRVDKLKVPANVLKSYVKVEEETLLEAGGKQFLSKGERKQARETATLRAEQELKSGAFRTMNSYPVLIDLEQGVVYLAGLGAGLADKVMALFGDTFGCGLEPADAERVANRLMLAAGRARSLENMTASHLVRVPDGYEQGGADFSPGYLNFLGREFLSWLWYGMETGAGPLRVASGNDVSIGLDKSLRLKCDFGLTGTDTIAADNPTGLPESKAALRVGKQPVKAGLVMGSPVGDFRLTLDGERLAVSGLVLPEEEGEQDQRARVEQRFELLSDAAGLVDAMFEQFLLKRTSSSEWETELRAMRAWVKGERQPKLVSAAAGA